MAKLLPTIFIPHGGGPWPFVKTRFVTPPEFDALKGYLESVGQLATPKALLVISAHWEEDIPTVMSGPAPGMLYDYYGFPEESYRLQWPAPGNPELAGRVRDLLGEAGFPTAEDNGRGYDHGTFIPMMLAFPGADIPTVQLSLVRGLDPAQHIAMGRALVPLREEGVLIIGSGMSYHNLRGFGDPRSVGVSAAFDAWLKDAATAAPGERHEQLSAWEQAPSARDAHPREEHLLPLMVVSGAAGNDPGRVAFEGTMLGAKLSAFQYG